MAMYGTLNDDILCRVIEKILSNRQENVQILVTITSKEPCAPNGEFGDVIPTPCNASMVKDK